MEEISPPTSLPYGCQVLSARRRHPGTPCDAPRYPGINSTSLNAFHPEKLYSDTDVFRLQEHWYTQDGNPQPDPKACLILSAISLIFNAFANIFLVVRFSAKAPFWWQHATRWSLIMWLAKTAVAAANLIAFGVLRRNGEGYKYDEGFWCAVVSIIAAGVICIALLLHYFMSFGDGSEDSQEVRKEGKRFMLSFTTFIAVMAVQSLVFCKVEHWAYSDAIYFSVQVSPEPLPVDHADLPLARLR